MVYTCSLAISSSKNPPLLYSQFFVLSARLPSFTHCVLVVFLALIPVVIPSLARAWGAMATNISDGGCTPHNPLLQQVRYLQSRLSAITFNYTSPSLPDPPFEASSDGPSNAAPAPPHSPSSPSRDIPTAGSVRSRSSSDAERKKTFYHFCHPPPSSANRLRSHGTPKLLLQIRRAEEDHGVDPAMEVYPAQAFLKQSKRPNLAITGRASICKDDLVITGCDSYSVSSNPSPAGDEESLKYQPILALIHRVDSPAELGNEHRAAIAVEDGLLIATKLANGNYEFSATEANGRFVRARWVRRLGMKSVSGRATQEEPSFKFVLVNKTDRRTYTVGAMDRYAMVVRGKHTTSEHLWARKRETAQRQQSTSSLPADGSSSLLASLPRRAQRSRSVTSPPLPPLARHESAAAPEIIVETTQQIKTLLLATGIWVAISEGWVPMIHNASSHTDGLHVAGHPPQVNSRMALIGRDLGEGQPFDHSLTDKHTLSDTFTRSRVGSHSLLRKGHYRHGPGLGSPEEDRSSVESAHREEEADGSRHVHKKLEGGSKPQRTSSTRKRDRLRGIISRHQHNPKNHEG